MTGAASPAGPAPRTLVLVLAPSLGILDSWLPVLADARVTMPDTRIVAVVPERRTVLAVDPSDTMVRLAEEVVDEVIVPAVDGAMLRAPGLVAARELLERERLATAVARLVDAARWRLGRARRHGPMPSWQRALLRPLRPRAVRRAVVDLAAHIGTDAHVCYDVHVHRHPASAALVASLGPLPRSSLHHGIDVLRDDGRRFPIPDIERDVAVGLFSELERDAYRGVHGLTDPVLDVVGIPRHDPAWMRRVIATSAQLHRPPSEDVVFVLSRPAGTSYLPADRKVASLAALHRVVCEQHGMTLVVKLHPKERDDGTIAAGLPPSMEGRSWHRVRAHPFHVAEHALAAVAFHSGVLIDMVALGVPAIELIDVRGLPEHDRPDALRDARGRPIHSALRAHGLVLPADDEEDLARWMAEVRRDRAALVDRLRTAYRAVFPDPDGAIAAVRAGLLRRGPARA